ncbi:MAG: hypothetical protein A2Y38_05810 [Spirochaetes bacterium GWB1_59_5]|nr:MAG: hypothetical protein A2Y38_05810 [Spirochaetes bacterium GWB1_59_5]
MKLTVLALVALVPAITVWSQEGQSGFDPDAFFSPAGSGTGETEASASTQSARPAGLEFSGDASADILYTVLEPFDESARTSDYTGATSLRLDATGGDRNEAKVEASAIVLMIYGVAEAPVMSFELKKLYLSIYTALADISAGRMVINYGRGTVFSPVDLFSAVDTSDLGLGRTGTDALRALLPLGDFSGLDLVATLGASTGESIAGGRLYGNLAGVDAGVSAFGVGLADGSGDIVAGLDFKGDLELGVSAEAVARIPVFDWHPDGSETVYSLMFGADYSFADAWFIDAEYLWNLRTGDAYAVGAFRSDHTLFGAISWKPDELTALDLRCIAAPFEEAVQATFSLSRSVAAGASIVGYALYRSGDVEGRYLDGPAPSAIGLASFSLGIRLSVAY